MVQHKAKVVSPRVCVECGRPVESLFREYNKGNIRLGRCDYCCSVADKYIECEFVLVAIDLVLHRIEAYRHLLFNRAPFSNHGFKGRLWQLGVAMAALHAHLRHTALSSEPPHDRRPNAPAPSGEHIDPLWEAGGMLLASALEHVCFAAGAVLWAYVSTNPSGWDGSRDGGGVPGEPREQGRSHSAVRERGDGLTTSGTKLYMAIVYPMFFRLLAAFVMIWDQQVAILNTTEMLVVTMQFVALSAVVGEGYGGVAAASVGGGMAFKLAARGMLCVWFGDDPRILAVL